ncbi:MAG: hypothetical protein AB7O45_14880 [Alphaproteobacteria bacterium]
MIDRAGIDAGMETQMKAIDLDRVRMALRDQLLAGFAPGRSSEPHRAATAKVGNGKPPPPGVSVDPACDHVVRSATTKVGIGKPPPPT